LRPGNTVEVTSITTQPAMAYSTMTRMTRRRRNSEKKSEMELSLFKPAFV